MARKYTSDNYFVRNNIDMEKPHRELFSVPLSPLSFAQTPPRVGVNVRAEPEPDWACDVVFGQD